MNGGRFYNEALEKMPRRELLELRDKRLRWTVRHAYENNPFYRKKLDEAGVRPDDVKTAADLVKLPLQRRMS